MSDRFKSEDLKGRGAQINPPSRFDARHADLDPRANRIFNEGQLATEYITVHPKTIVNKVDSPDVPYNWSINPYQGCEHGCVYCYARNTHPYWGYSAGLDFEQKILVKKNAAQLLAKKLKSKSWKGEPIMLSGNTDAYQPIERDLKITRQILETCWRYKQTVGLLTKNALITRDLDILADMAKLNLVKAAVSVTSLDDRIRLLMEPRTATTAARLDALSQLSEAGIPTVMMVAPIIPSVNDMDILPLVEAGARAGIREVGYTTLRLNGDVATIFRDWMERYYPDRVEKVMNKVAHLHGGQVNDSQFKRRMRGEGPFAEIIRQQFKIARQKYLSNALPLLPLDTSLHQKWKSDQLSLF